MNAVFDIIVTIIVGVIGWLVVQWLASALGMPTLLVQLIGLLIFLYVAWKVLNLIKSSPPKI